MAHAKPKMFDIVDRKRQPDGTVLRELSCGCWVKEPSGGRASKEAMRAICPTHGRNQQP